MDLQGNGPVCQVEISPEILFVYRAHLVMVVYKIFAANSVIRLFLNLSKSNFHGIHYLDVLNGFPFIETTAWCILRLWMEEKASGYGGYILNKYGKV
jgi:hypothetical protein